MAETGSYFCKAGWIINEKPPLVFRNIAAKHRGKKETILDYIFSHLGIHTSGCVNHPIVMSEAVCNPNYSRQCLFGLVISLGYNTCHVLPVVRSRFDVRNAKRINIGSFNMANFFQRILQLKYSAHASAITLSRVEALQELARNKMNLRVPEILFQPTMVGIEQAGLAETIEMVLARYTINDQQKLAENVFITGGTAKLPFIKDRIETELLAMRPFQSKFNVHLADDPLLDAWRGARKWASNDDNLKKFSVTRQEYEEKGGDYLKDHICSNHYVSQPAPAKKTLVAVSAFPSTSTKQEQKVT
ncbi:Actin-related protein 5 like protein [Argiope bruennichi]|uniref:Actin-related protein 5 like protein n=1 Tax=Argiope bruennichi TaxID=94029 RepID=A0A8T0F2I5_ARGBR|nr:Actin-related protein 5 like protein [Argiope bruennichi]